MSNPAPDMIDAVFDISGGPLPANYHFALWKALLGLVPALAEDSQVGVLPLKTADSEGGRLLPKRAKLVLRLPAELSSHSTILTGQQLDIDGSPLQLGNSKLRDIQPYPTLHAHLVIGTEDEVEFLKEVAARLTELCVAGKLICGMRASLITTEREIHGYSLVIHDLKPDASLRLQYAGLGTDRHLGCGIFVPYKVITDLD